MGEKGKTMEHQRRMGRNATTLRRKKPNTKQLTKMDQTIRRQQQKITIIKMISAWKQATTYLINNRKHVKYAETPEITPLEINKYKQNKRKLVRTYNDKITIPGKKHDLNMEKIIEIKYTEQTKKMQQAYRDTTRKRKTNSERNINSTEK